MVVLSGIPEPLRRERLIVPIQAFIDDSGVKGTDPVFVFAGQIAPAVMWVEFSIRWHEALIEKPGIRYFKMYEAHRLKGEFQGWSLDARNAKLLRLASLISEYGFTAIHCTTNLKTFDDSYGSKLPRPFRDPYFWPFYLMVMGVCAELMYSGQKNRCEVIFDEHKIFAPRVKLWYPIVRALVTETPQSALIAAERVLPIEPVFRTDADEMPLQAADMLAWFFRRKAPGSDPADNQFDWLLPRLFTMPVSDFSTTMSDGGWQPRFQPAYSPSVIDKIAKKYDEMCGDAE